MRDELREAIGEMRKYLSSGTDIMNQTDSSVYIRVHGREFFRDVERMVADKWLLSCLFCNEEPRGTDLFYVFSRSDIRQYIILIVSADNPVSIARVIPVASLYEREITDGFGIPFSGAYDTRPLFLHECYPEGFHPLKRSFRNGHIKPVPRPDRYKFREISGTGVHQIPVGPVHAGIIEPGHFRFHVIGESILNLEIRMFYLHRGIEKLAEGKKPDDCVRMAESVSGDESVANALAFCMAVEEISRAPVPERAVFIRGILQELERVYVLLSDLSGMLTDVAYAAGAAKFMIIREEFLRLNEEITGSRFLRGCISIGGVRGDISGRVREDLSTLVREASELLPGVIEDSLSAPGIMDRFSTTGKIRRELIAPLHLTGPIARASGSSADVRSDHRYGVYSLICPNIPIHMGDDVLSRFQEKSAEIIESLSLIRRMTEGMPPGEICTPVPYPDGHAFTAVEGPRGENVTFVSIKDGLVSRYKVRTASFCNWQAIEHAVMGNIVPDFPLINKSLNLSYAGTDL